MPDNTIRDRWFLLTNRRNLIGMCTQRLISPRWGLEKYYPDLLEMAPGFLPLIEGGADPSLVNLMSSDSGGSYPVLIEVSVSPEFGDLRIAESGASLLLLDGGIGLDSVTSVHFRSDVELSEFVAREFDNFDPSHLNVASSPSLFDSHGLTSEDISSICSTLEPIHLNPESVRELDGAVGGIAVLFTRDPVEAGSLPEVFKGCQSLIASLLDADKPVTEILRETVTPLLLGSNPTPGDADLLNATFGSLVLGVGSSDISPTAIIDSIVADMQSSSTDTESMELVIISLKKVRAVLLGEQPLSPFRRGTGLNSAKGLLLFLLRPGIRDVGSWSAEDVGSVEVPMLIAAVLAGLVHGYQRRPIELRGEPGLDDLLGKIRCDALNQRASSRLPRTSPDDIGISVRAPVGESTQITILSNEIELFSPTLKAPDLVATVIENPTIPAEVVPILVEILRKLKWDDAIITTISGQHGEFSISGRRVQVSMRGKTDIAYAVDRDRLVKLLKESDGAFRVEAESILDKQQRGLLGQPPKKRATRPRKRTIDTPIVEEPSFDSLALNQGN